MNTQFDRVRTRLGTADPRRQPGAARVVASGTAVGRDAEGKRALFSSTSPDADVPGVGSITIDCRRCAERTVMSPVAVVRAALPSLLLSVAVGRGDRETDVGLVRRRYGAFLRCPACGRGSWTRLTVRL